MKLPDPKKPLQVTVSPWEVAFGKKVDADRLIQEDQEWQASRQRMMDARKKDDAKLVAQAEKARLNAPELKAAPSKLESVLEDLGRGAKTTLTEGIPHFLGNISNLMQGLPEVPSEYRRSPGVFQEDVPTSLTEDAANMVLDPSNLVGGAMLKPLGRALKKALPVAVPAVSSAYADDAEASKFNFITPKRLKDLISRQGYATQDKAKGALGWVSARDWMNGVVPNEDYLAQIVKEAGKFDPERFSTEGQYPFTLVKRPDIAPYEREVIGHEGRHRIGSALLENGEDFDLPMMFQSYSGHPSESWKDLRGMIRGEDFGSPGRGQPFTVRGTQPLQYGNEENLLQFLEPDERQHFAKGGLARLAARLAADSAPSRRGVAEVVKEKGGNWLTGSVEDSLSGIKRYIPEDFDDRQPFVPHPSSPGNLLDRYGDLVDEAGAKGITRDQSINSFIDKQLTRYVKNDMATPGDPIRALAEKGVLHFNPAPSRFGPERARRQADGLVSTPSLTSPGQIMGKSDLARLWEDVSDQSIATNAAVDLRDPKFYVEPEYYNQKMDGNSWLNKVPGETPVHSPDGGYTASNMGFDHLIDELSNAINPESGLPRHLQFPADRLDRVSVPQAVERVSEINAWRKALKVEEDLKRANNAATVLHKEYPDKGMKWVELTAQKKPTDATSSVDDMFNAENFEEEQRKALADALKYEGDMMGHCVGGYCEDVASGRSRIYSLRDAKGQPHVTIEVSPQPRNIGQQDIPDRYIEMAMDEMGIDSPEAQWGKEEQIDKLAGDLWRKDNPDTQRIVQIKGKGNAKPIDEYLPMVQDFVKSGQWSDVGDLQNTGLMRNKFDQETLKRYGKEYQPFVNQQELDDIMSAIYDVSKPQGLAHGGSIQAKPVLTVQDLQGIIDQLSERQFHA